MRASHCLTCLTILLSFVSPLAAQAPAAKTLDIYLIDTEGGQATLFVAPSGETVLVDTGNPGTRDPDRIVAAMREAGVSRLDYVLLTHYHSDHVGGLEELAKRVPIAHYVDHGPTIEEREMVPGFQKTYAALYSRADHRVVQPGDRLDLPGIDWEIVSAAGKVLDAPLPGAGQSNPYCAETEPQNVTRDLENGQSVGSLITYGEFRAIDLGDLLVKQELELMCPVNRIGTVDLYITSHHGLDLSGSAALVHAIAPRVAVMNDGSRKGGSPRTFQILRSSPGLEDLWELHWSFNVGLDYNSPGVFIANVEEPSTLATFLTASDDDRSARRRRAPHDGPAALIKVSASPDGSFTVTNTRNGFSKTYASGG